ncbi:MAG: acetylglutamate kinase [Cyclobacteriaceae bacterium]|nr:acetylglutamate kinase [Cyclobacteriaceae bacterium HetDA_MAG_MS6]
MSKDQLFVIKVGGGVIEDEEKLQSLLESFAAIPGKKILVHGGGRLATDIGDKLGYQAKIIEGRRITDNETIDIVSMVFAGLVNKKVVSRLQALSCNALGVTGADGDLIRSGKRPVKFGIDFGWVGDPRKVNAELLAQWLEGALVPVIAPLTHDGRGHILNTNADTVANVVATAMAEKYETHLIYAFELKGVMKDIDDPSTLIHNLNKRKYQDLKTRGRIFQGMIPKLDNAFQAIAEGVSSVRIMHYAVINELSNEEYNEFTLIQ